MVSRGVYFLVNLEFIVKILLEKGEIQVQNLLQKRGI